MVLSRFVDFDNIFDDIDYDEIFGKNNFEEIDENKNNEAIVLDEKLDSNEVRLQVLNYSIGGELVLNNMRLEIELNNKIIYDQNNVICQVMLIEMEKKESYKCLINPPNDNVSV